MSEGTVITNLYCKAPENEHDKTKRTGMKHLAVNIFYKRERENYISERQTERQKFIYRRDEAWNEKKLLFLSKRERKRIYPDFARFQRIVCSPRKYYRRFRREQVRCNLYKKIFEKYLHTWNQESETRGERVYKIAMHRDVERKSRRFWNTFKRKKMREREREHVRSTLG